MNAFYISALFLGLVSSLHCGAMCGPLVLAMPKNNNLWLSGIVENSGRILTYMLLGLLFALMGQLINIQKYQNIFSLIVGCLILIYFCFSTQFKNVVFSFKISEYISKVYKKTWRSFITKKSFTSLFLTGVCHGLLPCGMVYIALSSSLLVNEPLGSMTYMLFFGLGTSPLLFTIIAIGPNILSRLKIQSFNVEKFAILTMAILLILRGLSLGIPYISPASEESCCSVSSVKSTK